jgi:hypothetical protein
MSTPGTPLWAKGVVDVDAAVRAARDIARLLDIEPVGHLARCGSRQELLKGAAQ